MFKRDWPDANTNTELFLAWKADLNFNFKDAIRRYILADKDRKKSSHRLASLLLGLHHFTGYFILKNEEIGQQLIQYGRQKEVDFLIAQAVTQPSAQFYLGILYFFGFVVNQNIAKAINLFENAAQSGHGVAQIILAELYVDGSYLNEDYRKAFELFERSAQQGNMAAQFLLAGMYQSGFGVEVNTPKAIELYHSSAEQKYANALYTLSLFYQVGLYVEANLIKAIFYCWEAAQQGHDEAKIFLLSHQINHFHIYSCLEDATLVLQLFKQFSSEEVKYFLIQKDFFGNFPLHYMAKRQLCEALFNCKNLLAESDWSKCIALKNDDDQSVIDLFLMKSIDHDIVLSLFEGNHQLNLKQIKLTNSLLDIRCNNTLPKIFDIIGDKSEGGVNNKVLQYADLELPSLHSGFFIKRLFLKKSIFVRSEKISKTQWLIILIQNPNEDHINLFVEGIDALGQHLVRKIHLDPIDEDRTIVKPEVAFLNSMAINFKFDLLNYWLVNVKKAQNLFDEVVTQRVKGMVLSVPLKANASDSKWALELLERIGLHHDHIGLSQPVSQRF